MEPETAMIAAEAEATDRQEDANETAVELAEIAAETAEVQADAAVAIAEAQSDAAVEIARAEAEGNQAWQIEAQSLRTEIAGLNERVSSIATAVETLASSPALLIPTPPPAPPPEAEPTPPAEATPPAPEADGPRGNREAKRRVRRLF